MLRVRRQNLGIYLYERLAAATAASRPDLCVLQVRVLRVPPLAPLSTSGCRA
jgi:hypothetical protein